jgi:hypothetical protein
MKVKAVFEFNYPDDENDFKVYSKAHDMHAGLLRILDRIDEYRKDDDNPDSVISVIEDKVKLILKDVQ